MFVYAMCVCVLLISFVAEMFRYVTEVREGIQLLET